MSGAVLERLEALGYDGEEENLRCLVQVARPSADGYRRALEELAPAAGADAAALRGRLLTHLGRHEEAVAALSGAAASVHPARAWLGQALLLGGRFEEAAPVLDAAVAERPAYPWVWFSRAALRLALGERDAARADAARFMDAGPRAAALALSAVTAFGTDAAPRGLAGLDEAARLAPKQAWPHVLKALLLRGAGELAAARQALDDALAAEPSPSLYEERAKVWEDLGDLPRALDDAAEVLRLCPCEAHRLYKAHLHECWREYDLAAAEYGAALAGSPERSDLLFLRSKALSTLGRIEDARRDARDAARLRPENEDLEFWQLQLGILLADAGVDSRLAALAASESEPVRAKAHFYQAYAELFAGRGPEAVAALDRCLALEAGPALRQRASFYRAAAAGVGERPPGAPMPELCLLGLGVDPPFTATLESLRAAARCSVLFNNVPGEEIFELLRLFCRDVRPLAYHQNEDEERLSHEILAELRPGRSVGFVTRGHATIYGGLGRELIARCEKQGRTWRNVPSMSSSDLFIARHGRNEKGKGLLVLDGPSAAKDPALLNPAVPLVLYLGSNLPDARFIALCDSLERAYGKDHPCLAFDHRVDQEPKRLAMSAVAGLRGRLSPSAIFYIPGAGA